ncbi:hypothetical protein XA68_16276 [Ophiocordyceps unilateralis]|uniref:Survival Motor Neuron Gemin2-binding domain-containing protein n=1 Tax=Ophiocordyceps unilateralis TaxID=268505 RepID=A0A2A9P5X7_OPHUN|nr:hypothetical protein XA68_16276 [Ophiocordyceps unilateralis]
MAQVDEAVWDDSALVDSWNDALNEYKKYHSIRANGGSIRDLERGKNPPIVDSTSLTDGLDSGATGGPKAPCSRQGGQCQEDEEEEEGEIVSTGGEHPSDASSTGGTDPPLGNHGVHQFSAPIPTQAVLGSIQDENLKRLLMAWYYAGYYMGLYEGHQQAQQSPL